MTPKEKLLILLGNYQAIKRIWDAEAELTGSKKKYWQARGMFHAIIELQNLIDEL